MSNDMKKQVVFIHGGETFDSYEDYIAWLKNPDYDPFADADVPRKSWSKNLAEDLGDGYQVIVPSMPNAKNAQYAEWEIWFGHLHKYLHSDVILIGHSLGATFLAKYLSESDLPVEIAQLHLVAGCYGCTGGFDLIGSLENIQKQAKDIYIYHSKGDPIVDYVDAQKYQKALSQAKFVSFDDRGHFLDEKFPELVNTVTLVK